jgi:integrase/recombinase XerC
VGNLLRLPRRPMSMMHVAECPDIVVAAHLRHLQLLDHTPGTIYCRSRALARLAAVLPVPLLEAAPADLMIWRAGLSVGPATIAAYVSHARAFYAWALAEHLIDASPAAGLPVPRLPRRLPRPIGEDDLMTAVTAAPDRIRPWLVLGSCCGLRAKEIALLRRECVLETRSPAMVLVAADATKGRTERLVPLSRFVVGELQAAGLPRAGWVFRRRDGQPGPNQPWIVSQLSNAYLHSLGIAATLHQLRHRFATVLYAQGHDLRRVQEYLGHAHVNTTALYVDYDQAGGAAAVEALPIPVPRHLKAVCCSTETESGA